MDEMADHPISAPSPITPSIFAKIVLSAITAVLVVGYGLLSVSVIRNESGVNSPAGIVVFEIFAGLIVLSVSAYLLRSAFARVQVNSREVICKSPLGTKRIPIGEIKFAEFYYSKNGANLMVFAGRRRFLLLGLGLSEDALREIQGQILRAGAGLSKTIPTQRPQPNDKEFVGAMSAYGLMIVFGGLGLILFLVYRALGHA